jgi:allantoicase
MSNLGGVVGRVTAVQQVALTMQFEGNATKRRVAHKLLEEADTADKEIWATIAAELGLDPNDNFHYDDFTGEIRRLP